MTKIKICGIYKQEDLIFFNGLNSSLLPDYLGFIMNFPKSHRNIGGFGLESARNFLNNVNQDIKRVGVFVNASLQEIADYADCLEVIQLHGQESQDYIKTLKALYPQKEIWQAVKVQSLADVQEAEKSVAHHLLLDNGYGTGKCFDWNILQEADTASNFFLAGGLNPDNVVEAVEKYQPYGVDVSSGVETDKVKDFDKILRFIERIKNIDENN